MIPNKQQVSQCVITAIFTFIVAMVGVIIFDIGTAIYSGVAAGMCITVGKEYGDSLVIENSWHWSDVIPGAVGVIAGLLVFILFYLIR